MNKLIILILTYLLVQSYNISAQSISDKVSYFHLGIGMPTITLREQSTSDILPIGWRLRFSSTEVKLANGTRFEDGLNPTISATTDSLSQAVTSKGAIIEKALLELK